MFSKTLHNRRLCLALTLGSLAYLILHLIGIDLMPCPIQQLFHKPCPGCGLTRAVGHLSRGSLSNSLEMHALAIPYLIVFSLIGAAAILPDKARTKLISTVQITEKYTKWPILLICATIAYSLTRLTAFY